MKRTFDLSLAILLAPLACVLCLLAAIPIMLECRASPFFSQIRLGVKERPFRLFKLRTMNVATPAAASHEIGKDSILVTGRLLRRLKIDELPQIWNVLNGSMSFVGPRPGLPSQTILTESRRRHQVFTLKPGITGVSQISGLDMSTPEQLAAMDKIYDRPWSLKLDLNILWRTVRGSGRGDAAHKAPLQ